MGRFFSLKVFLKSQNISKLYFTVSFAKCPRLNIVSGTKTRIFHLKKFGLIDESQFNIKHT